MTGGGVEVRADVVISGHGELDSLLKLSFRESDPITGALPGT
jgi:hypothetical protein